MAASPTEGFALIDRAALTIGKYLGGGGFGSVSLASHKHWGDVAVKEFRNITVTDEVRKEARKMLRAIHSPYIVRIMGLMDDPGNLSIVMEYFENGSLKSFQRKYMDCECWARKVKMMLDISLGMNYLHTLEPPIVHLDLKLDNVFVGNGFEAKIGDLGLAISATSTQHFQTGDTPGTCSHIPPEAWEGTIKIPDIFWDIFTFAITLFEFLSGKDPWQAFAKPVLIAHWVTTNKRPDVSAIPSEAPREIIEIMEKCWIGKPSERPKFQEIQQKISNIYQNRYKKDIRTADIAIIQRMHEVDTSAKKEGALSSQDSGFGTVVGGVKQLSVGSSTWSTTTDSGMGASAESHTTPCQEQAALTKETHSVQQWRIVKQFGTEGNGQGQFKMARGIAVCNNDDIVVIEWDLERVYIFSKDYQYQFTLISPQGNPKAKLSYPIDVTVTSQGHIAVVDESKYVKLFDVDGSYLHSLCTLSNDEPDTKVNTTSIAVAPDGNILVGDAHRKLVTLLGSDGGLIKQVNMVNVNIKPYFLATNSRHEIFASDWQARQVVGIDYAGNELFRLNTFMVDGEKGLPVGLTCGDDNTIYLAVCELNESTGNTLADTGHIHQYSSSGRFMRCLIKGLYHPQGIIWHNGFLYVANSLSVVILGPSLKQ